MTIHSQSHPAAGQTLKIRSGVVDPIQNLVLPGQEYHVEDYWDVVSGGRSWMNTSGNPAVMQYAIRSALNDLPLDDEVLYGKIGALGHIVHISELTT